MNKTNSLILKLGTLQTVIMGLYYFYIPFQFNWGNYLEQRSPANYTFKEKNKEPQP